MPRIATRLLYVADLRARGRELFAVGCQYDLDDVVGKWRYGRYEADGVSTSWVKIKNPEYSQMVGRRELFEARGDRRKGLSRLSPTLRLRPGDEPPDPKSRGTIRPEKRRLFAGASHRF